MLNWKQGQPKMAETGSIGFMEWMNGRSMQNYGMLLIVYVRSETTV